MVNIELVKMLSTKRKIYAALNSCPETPKSIRNQLSKNATVPVYIPIPVFKFFETPVIQHYPINQVSQTIFDLRSGYRAGRADCAEADGRANHPSDDPH